MLVAVLSLQLPSGDTLLMSLSYVPNMFSLTSATAYKPINPATCTALFWIFFLFEVSFSIETNTEKQNSDRM